MTCCYVLARNTVLLKIDCGLTCKHTPAHTQLNIAQNLRADADAAESPARSWLVSLFSRVLVGSLCIAVSTDTRQLSDLVILVVHFEGLMRPGFEGYVLLKCLRVSAGS